MASRTRHTTRAVAAGLMVIGLVLVSTAPVASHFDPDHGPGASLTGSVTLSGLGNGSSTTGFVAPAGFDPTAGYPAAPPSGSTPANEGFAGLVHAASNTTPPVELLTYCIDLQTLTWVGLSYALASWDASNVPNVGFVARILNEYFPTTGQPAGAANDDQRAASVQAAIWFFTDRYILDASDPVHDLTEAIVTAVLAAGTLPEPSLPLAITGPPTGVEGSVIGPFAIDTTAAEVVVTVVGGQLFSDAAATNPIANGATIPSTSQLFLLPDGPGTAQISVRAAVVTPGGHVLLYAAADPAAPNPEDAQTLILAGDGLVTSSASITIDVTAAPEPTPIGSGGVAPDETVNPTAPLTSTATPDGTDTGSGLGGLVVTLLGFSLALGYLSRRHRSPS